MTDSDHYLRRRTDSGYASAISAGCCCAVPIGPGWWRPSARSCPTPAPTSFRSISIRPNSPVEPSCSAPFFTCPGLTAARDALEHDFGAQVAAQFDMDFRLTEAAKPKRVAIMASKDDHCLLDLLWRNRRGELDMSVAMVIANHPDLADQVRPFGVPFVYMPATKDIRAQAEQRQLEALRGNVDLVVLARYMQILSPRFLVEVGCPVINIHHSFLPSFVGAAPVSAGQGARCQTRRRDRPLRDRSTRRGTDHRTGRRAGRPPARRRRPDPRSAPTSNARCCPGRSRGIARTASSDGNQTIVF